MLTAGFRPADIIGLDAIFTIHPRDKMYYISESTEVVYGKSNFGIKPNTTFSECPQLDVLIIGETNNDSTKNIQVLEFVKKQYANVQYIIAVSSGVLALYNTGILQKQSVTADKKTLKRLENTSLALLDKRKCVTDGKIVTAGPSTGGIEAAYTVFDKIRGKWLTQMLEFNLEYNAKVQYPLPQAIMLEQPPLPKPIKVGVFMDDNIYLPDIMGATDVFGCIPNCEIYFIGNQTGLSKSILHLGPQFSTNTTIENCPNLDVLILGASHPRYISDISLQNFIIKQEKSAKAIISVCEGTFIVGATGLLEGRSATTNYHQIKDLPQIKAHYAGTEVAEDGKYFSAGPAVGSYEVGLKVVEKIAGKEWAQYIEHQNLEFSPNPLYSTNPKNAPKSILKTTNFLSFFLRKIYRPNIKKAMKKGNANKTPNNYE